MGFSTFVVTAGGAAGKGSGFGASLIKARGAPASLKLFLRMEVAARLGWTDGDRLAVQLGHGEDHGLLRLRRSDAGTAAVKRRVAGRGAGAEFIQITLGHVPAFVDRSEGKRWCQYEVLEGDEAGWVEVVLPSWADETGAKRQRVLPGPKALALPAPTTARDPGRLPGDPPPGRSALDQRAPVAPPSRGAARRVAEAREADDHARAEAADWNAKAADDQRLSDIMAVLGLTLHEARLVKALMDARTASKERLFAAIYGADPNGGPDPKVLDVMVHKARRKLKTRLVEIETVWGQGWRMAPEHIARVMVLLDGGAPGRDEDEAELAALGDDDDDEAEDAA